MIKTDSRLAFLVCAFLTVAAGSVGLMAGSQTSSRPVVGDPKWTGVWVLTIDGPGRPEKQALSVYVAPEWVPEHGKVVATLKIGRGGEIEITDVVIRGNDLALTYQQQGQRGAVDVVSTLSLAPDGSVTVRTKQSQRTRSGTGRLAVSAALLNELLDESDVSLMMKKARAAGLVAERTNYGGGASTFVVKEAATGMVVLTGRVTP